MFYTKDEKSIPETVISGVLECNIPMAAHKQKEHFNDMLCISLSDHNVDKIKEIQKTILQYEEDTIDKDTLCRILKENGVKEEDINVFRSNYCELEKKNGTIDFITNNISDKKAIIEMNKVEIIAPAEESFFSIQKVDGRKCIVIPITGELSLNGIPCN